MKKDYSLLGYIFIIIGSIFLIKNLFNSKIIFYNSVLPVIAIIVGCFLIYTYINMFRSLLALLIGLILIINGAFFVLNNIFWRVFSSYSFSFILLSISISIYIIQKFERRYYELLNISTGFFVASLISAFIILAKNILMSIKLSIFSPIIFLLIGCFILYNYKLIK